MSDKRFEKWNDYSCKVKDNQENTLLDWEDVVDLLNEQQAIIDEQKIAIDELITDYKKLEKENEQLKLRIAFFEEQEDEFEKYTAQTIQNMIADYREGQNE